MPAERSRTFSYFLLPAHQELKVSYLVANCQMSSCGLLGMT